MPGNPDAFIQIKDHIDYLDRTAIRSLFDHDDYLSNRKADAIKDTPIAAALCLMQQPVNCNRVFILSSFTL